MHFGKLPCHHHAFENIIVTIGVVRDTARSFNVIFNCNLVFCLLFGGYFRHNFSPTETIVYVYHGFLTVYISKCSTKFLIIFLFDYCGVVYEPCIGAHVHFCIYFVLPLHCREMLLIKLVS